MFEHLFRKMLWRYFTGAHMDGRHYTNASWWRHGSMPRSNITWWNSKPRAHRMAWRWLIIAIPVGWVLLFEHYHFYTMWASIALAPYAIHRTWHEINVRARQSVNVPRHFESRPEDINVSDLTFEVETKEKKVK